MICVLVWYFFTCAAVVAFFSSQVSVGVFIGVVVVVEFLLGAYARAGSI